MSRDRSDLHDFTNDPTLYREVFAGLGHGIVVLSTDGLIIDVNDAHLDLVGRRREELVGHFSPDYTHPDDLERLLSLMVGLVDGEREEIRTSYRFVARDGTTHTTRLSARLIDFGDKGPVIAVAYSPDDDIVTGLEEDDVLDDGPLHLFFGRANFVLHHLDGSIARVGIGTARLLGRTNEELTGRRWSDSELGAMLPGGQPLTDDRDPVDAAALAGMAELETVRFSRPDGSHVWVSIRATLTPFSGGKAVVSALTDVTELVEALEERTRLASIVEATSDLIGSFRLDGSCSWLNPSAEHTLGVTAEDFDLFAALGPSATHFRRRALAEVLDTGRWSGELVVRVAVPAVEGVEQDIHLAANMIADHDDEGRTVGWTLVGHDFTEYKSLQATLAHRATHDTLTGLPNRSLLTERMAEMAKNGVETTVMFVDLDGFKALNDTFGHEFGDDALVVVGRRIAAAVEDGGFAARFGGDEFVVIPNPDWADPPAELERRVFAEPYTVGPIILDISGRIGMATAHPSESGIALIARADREMYRAKHSRRASDRPPPNRRIHL